MVTIQADRAGLQLAQVRRRPAQRRRWSARCARSSQDGEEAVIAVALEPDAADEIPANVDVQILPTTLFGQKFISFVRPANPVRARSRTATSSRPTASRPTSSSARSWPTCSRCCARSRPADLNTTLNALATALEGRGEQLGETLDELDAYLGAISD